jgi:hypothetical protein
VNTQIKRRVPIKRMTRYRLSYRPCSTGMKRHSISLKALVGIIRWKSSVRQLLTATIIVPTFLVCSNEERNNYLNCKRKHTVLILLLVLLTHITATYKHVEVDVTMVGSWEKEAVDHHLQYNSQFVC